MGDISAGKTSLLRMFMKYINLGRLDDIGQYDVVKTDFSGESRLTDEEKENKLNEKATKTIQPNRLIFRDKKSGQAHTILAPGGDVDRSVVRMGIVTVNRIASHIIAVFSMDRDLEMQFDFFNKFDLRYLPEKVYVCVNKIDLIDGDKETIEKKIKELSEAIHDFFKGKKIIVTDMFFTCAEEMDDFRYTKRFNENVAKMMLDIAVG